MPKAVSKGVEIYYEVSGSGEPIVFSHELAGDYRSWRQQVQFFSSYYRVVTYNFKGYPPSHVPTSLSAYSQDQAVDDLLALLDHLDISEAHLVGLSMGGNVSLNFAIKYPQRTKSLVVAGTGNGSDKPEDFLKSAENFADRLDSRDLTAKTDFTKNQNRQQLRHKDKSSWQEFVNYFMEHPPIGLAHTLRRVLARRPTIYSLEKELRSLEVPALIMVGDEDKGCIKPSLFMNDCIPQSRLVIFPQSGHLLNLEEPELFNTEVLNFTTKVERDGYKEYSTKAEKNHYSQFAKRSIVRGRN
jgi:pimeloyl-ACP methyl ester carboxylesterase